MIAAGSYPDPVADAVEQVAQELWSELKQRVPLARVREITREAASHYKSVRVQTYVPLFLRRRSRDLLRGELAHSSRKGANAS